MQLRLSHMLKRTGRFSWQNVFSKSRLQLSLCSLCPLRITRLNPMPPQKATLTKIKSIHYWEKAVQAYLGNFSLSPKDLDVIKKVSYTPL